MKKVFSVVLMIMVIFTTLPAFAQETEAGVTMQVTMAEKLYYNEIAKIHCTITNPQEAMGAEVRLYLDGVRIEGAGSEYFVLGAQNNENFDFLVPETLDVQYLHTVLFELICGNGQTLYSAHVFAVSDKPAFSMRLFSVPEAVNPGYELYFGVRFSTPPGRVFKLSGTGFVRGAEVPDSKQELIIYNGLQFYVTVPQSMNEADPADFVFSYTVRANDPQSPVSPVTVSYDAAKMTAELMALKKIEALIIPVTVNYTTSGYAYSNLTGKFTTVPAGTVAEYLNPDNSHSMKSAKIKLPSGTVCWVPMWAVNISRTNYTIKDVLTDADKEAFVNEQGYDSKTDYLVWVNKQRQILVLFTGEQGNWKVSKVYPVATGKNATPTPTKVCEYQYKTRWVTEEYICDPVLSLFEAYAIHNQPVSHSGYVLDRTIGNPASAGCIRMLKKDVDELYSIIPVGTRVVLY
ncbi:MAG: L,D-transpeptidase [Ruminococcaceae bacterium]|nr:L,D-transpeptidase [Oscillospiraceae bacterium]